MHASISTPVRRPPREPGRVFARNSAANLTRFGITSLVSVFLPAYLTRHLSVEVYGAWVLILQMGAYVAYLDFGVQTAVAKYIAEYDAKGDCEGCNRCASVGFVILAAATVLGICLTLGLTWAVPELFRKMPVAQYRDVRIGILFVGTSLSIGLSASVFSAIFLGLQRYQVPMIATVIGKLLYAVALCLSVYFHGDLAIMGAAVALANLLAAALQVILWKRLAGHVSVALQNVDRGMLRQMLAYCGVMTIWLLCMLFVSGIDLMIVGHYDFAQTAFYSIAASPTNFIVMVIGAILGPLLPATSALSTERTPSQMSEILVRATRYAGIILLASGLPAIVAGYPLISLWVGANYASHSVEFLRILLLANIIRNFCLPYATMVVATAKQLVATASAVTEALVNLIASVWLAKHYGAMGVAAGTLIGAVAGVALHFAVSMIYTRNVVVSRLGLFVKGILLPATIAIPSLLLLPRWKSTGNPSMNWQLWLMWGLSTLLLTWWVGLSGDDRTALQAISTGRTKRN
jgi:O-antigen/teichoic acid export membrane protein